MTVHRFCNSAVQCSAVQYSIETIIVSAVQIIAYEQIREDKYRHIKMQCSLLRTRVQLEWGKVQNTYR